MNNTKRIKKKIRFRCCRRILLSVQWSNSITNNGKWSVVSEKYKNSISMGYRENIDGKRAQVGRHSGKTVRDWGWREKSFHPSQLPFYFLSISLPLCIEALWSTIHQHFSIKKSFLKILFFFFQVPCTKNK